MFPIESRRPTPPGVARPPVDCPPLLTPDQLVVAPSQPAVGVVLVRLQGELDGFNAPRVRRVLELTGLHEQLATSPALADAVLAEAS